LEVNPISGGGQFSQEVHSDQTGEEKTPITKEQKTQETIRDKKTLPLLWALIMPAPLSTWDVAALRETAANRDRVFMTSPPIMSLKGRLSKFSGFQMCKYHTFQGLLKKRHLLEAL